MPYDPDYTEEEFNHWQRGYWAAENNPVLTYQALQDLRETLIPQHAPMDFMHELIENENRNVFLNYAAQSPTPAPNLAEQFQRLRERIDDRRRQFITPDIHYQYVSPMRYAPLESSPAPTTFQSVRWGISSNAKVKPKMEETSKLTEKEVVNYEKWLESDIDNIKDFA